MLWLLFDFRGRTSRAGWFISQFACLLLAVFWAFAPFILGDHALVSNFSSMIVHPKGVQPFSMEAMGPLWSMPGLAAFGVLFVWICMAGTVKRFHDLGRSGHLAFVALIPTAYQLTKLSGCEACGTAFENPTLAIVMAFLPSIIGMWLMVTCGLTAGEKAENQWGPPPSAMGLSGRRTHVNDPVEKTSKFAKFDDKYFEDYARQLASKAAAADSASAAFNSEYNRPTFGKR